MEGITIDYHLNLIAKKQIKDIRGFYTHVIASFLILPFIIYINLQIVPQFHWFWFVIGAWCIGLLIHWISVFAFSKMSLKKMQKITRSQRKLIKKEPSYTLKYSKEEQYVNAKKQTETIKNFYLHLLITIFSFPVIVFVNLEFVPRFHFFWLAFGGMFIGLFFHWLEVFGFEFLGLGKYWENKKIEEILKNYR